MTAQLTEVWRYPLKGLPGERLPEVALEARGPMPDDRRFAVVYNAPSGAPDKAWAETAQYVSLTHEDRLATLGLSYDRETTAITLTRQGKQVARGEAGTALGRDLLSQFFQAFLKGNPRGTPKVVEAPDRGFTEFDEHYLHLLNRASLEDLERVARKPVDARRFRANLMIEGLPAWAEFDWIGHRLKIGDCILEGAERTERCAGTMVNPDTAERDINPPRLLRAGFGHLDLGIYLRVVEPGTIREGDTIEVL